MGKDNEQNVLGGYQWKNNSLPSSLLGSPTDAVIISINIIKKAIFVIRKKCNNYYLMERRNVHIDIIDSFLR